MILKDGIDYLSKIQKDLETIDTNPDKIITMFLNEDETVIDLLNLMYRFKLNNKHIDDFINDNLNKIKELKDFEIRKSGENISLTLKTFKDAPIRVRLSSNLNNVIVYNMFKGDLEYNREKLERLMGPHVSVGRKSDVISEENENDSLYLKLFEKYCFKELNLKERLEFAKEYSLFFYELNKKSKRVTEKQCEYFKVKTFVKVFLMKNKYKKLNRKNIDLIKERKSNRSNYDLLEYELKNWIATNKDSIINKYDEAYNYLKELF